MLDENVELSLQDVAVSGMTLGGSAPLTPGDVGLVRGENCMLKRRLQQLHDDFNAEQGTVFS